MKTCVPRSLVSFALPLLFAAVYLAFLPLARAQGAPASAAAPLGPRASAGRQLLRGHVPAVLAGLEPIGRPAATTRLNLAIGLPLRNQPALAQLVQQLSDPAHSDYRHYRSEEHTSELQ